jgi:uncharacterized membrane protein
LLTQLRKQIWFVCLMVFAIGWSGVSIASMKVMPMSMQHQQMMSSMSVSEHQAMMQSASLQKLENHCDVKLNKLQQNQPTDHEQQNNNLKSCHTQSIQSKHIAATECQDCALFSCQSSIVWFNSDIPKMVTPDHFQNSHHDPANYQAQHLAGFWQEILRPPKA